MNRRRALGWLAASTALPHGGRAQTAAPHALAFPRDFGSHPEWRTEWWYITGHAQDVKNGAREFGFQLTFFRRRVNETQALRSAFAAKQLIFAHAAITDLQGARLWHDQRIAREGMGVAHAREGDADLRLRDWSLRRTPQGYAASLPADGFALDLLCQPTQAPLLQGDAGFSRKGPDAAQFSYYVSEPQLRTQGRLTLQGQGFDVEGRAWLDHEWSEALMHPDAVGWDWIGMNLHDGSALTAFRLRTRQGDVLWAGGSLRTAQGALRVFRHDELRFEPLRHWRSPASGATYPVEWRVHTPVGRYTLQARLDDQELDSRTSTGAIYWEGLSQLRDERGALIAQGYLEMTGYARALHL